MAEKQEEYRVLARKYRPQNFDDLIGQDALVRTLKNAIESGRIAHAFMLTGIRGVGKTTTARIIAKALNYTGADGNAGPTTGPTDNCTICQAIAEDRHPDIMEMDAASRTGIDDIREILDGVRYAPTSARYKVYIIDEVHMLSKAAFNALLKTLEEPPEHVKFIFATTEIRKVPITVLSRCQRFDLKRIEVDTLKDYYGQISKKENVTAEDAGLSLIARAADGSVRDGLSLLDQAIALSDGNVTEAQVQEMLGLADSARMLDLLENALKGKTKDSLDIMSELYKNGADPLVVLQDLLDLTHQMTKIRALPAEKSNSALPEGEQKRLHDIAEKLSMPTLGKTWQLLLKGLGEVAHAPNPQAAAEMVIIRLVYASNLPDPAGLVKKLQDNPPTAPAPNPTNDPTPPARDTVVAQGPGQGHVQAATQPAPTPAPIGALDTLEDITACLKQNGELILASNIALYVHPVKIEEGLIEFRPANGAPDRLAQDISRVLREVTGNRWIASISNEMGSPTLAEQEKERENALKEKVMQEPLIQNIMQLFPQSTVKNIIQEKDETT